MAKISMIVARSNNNAIGKDNKLLWHISEDLAHFKKKTEKKTVIMGRKTYDSIGRSLPNRRNIIITRDKNFMPTGAVRIDNAEDLSKLLNLSVNEDTFIINSMDVVHRALSRTNEEIFIIGGFSLYSEFMNTTDILYITEVDCYLEGDTFFPDISESLKLTSSRKSQNSEFEYSFDKYERI